MFVGLGRCCRGRVSLVDGIGRGDDGEVVDLEIYVCFFGMFGKGIKRKFFVINLV